jgi:hypothetical protein
LLEESATAILRTWDFWLIEDGIMSDDKLDLNGMFDLISSTFRLVGTANATGAIAIGAGFQTFEKMDSLSFARIVILLFLFGVAAFVAGYCFLLAARLELDGYLSSKTAERADWEQLFRLKRGTLSGAKRSFTTAVLLGAASVAGFGSGLFAVIFFFI